MIYHYIHYRSLSSWTSSFLKEREERSFNIFKKDAYEVDQFRKGMHIKWLEISAEHSTTHKSGSSAENNTSSICLETEEDCARYVLQKANMSLEKSCITRSI